MAAVVDNEMGEKFQKAGVKRVFGDNDKKLHSAVPPLKVISALSVLRLSVKRGLNSESEFGLGQVLLPIENSLSNIRAKHLKIKVVFQSIAPIAWFLISLSTTLGKI